MVLVSLQLSLLPTAVAAAAVAAAAVAVLQKLVLMTLMKKQQQGQQWLAALSAGGTVGSVFASLVAETLNEQQLQTLLLAGHLTPATTESSASQSHQGAESAAFGAAQLLLILH